MPDKQIVGESNVPGFHVVNYSRGGARIEVDIQDGPIKEAGVNGVQIDNVIEWCRDWIDERNKAFPCRENALVITKLDEALHWSAARKANREKRGVEGKNVA